MGFVNSVVRQAALRDAAYSSEVKESNLHLASTVHMAV